MNTDHLARILALALVVFGAVPTLAQPPIPGQEDPRIYRIIEAVSAQRLRADVQTLVDFGTRHTLSETASDTVGIGAARRWIEAEFRRISAECGGCLEVTTVSEVFTGERRIPDATEVVNVVAIQRGTVDPGRYVLMSGDIDSRVSDVMNATDPAPGANDNATGVAGVLEAARVLSQYKFRGSIVYAALSGEEQGLFGGRTVAAKAKAEGWRLQAVLNNDMIGNIHGIDGVIDNTSVRVFSDGTPPTETEEERRRRRFTGGEVDGISRQLARYIDTIAERYFPTLDVMMIYRLDRFGRGGHHTPFADQGFPAVRLMETHEHYDRQHQDLRVENGIHYGDTIDGIDFPYCAKVTALNAATLAALAWAPAPPTQVEIRGAVEPAAQLSWQPPELPDGQDAGVAGYRVYWRLTTSPTWDHATDVGRALEHTFEGRVIDNYFFGVASVSPEGHESPVVFPVPGRRR